MAICSARCSACWLWPPSKGMMFSFRVQHQNGWIVQLVLHPSCNQARHQLPGGHEQPDVLCPSAPCSMPDVLIGWLDPADGPRSRPRSNSDGASSSGPELEQWGSSRKGRIWLAQAPIAFQLKDPPGQLGQPSCWLLGPQLPGRVWRPGPGASALDGCSAGGWLFNKGAQLALRFLAAGCWLGAWFQPRP